MATTRRVGSSELSDELVDSDDHGAMEPTEIGASMPGIARTTPCPRPPSRNRECYERWAVTRRGGIFARSNSENRGAWDLDGGTASPVERQARKARYTR
jgi:hypothetical protein